jgi:hypothetical protein
MFVLVTDLIQVLVTDLIQVLVTDLIQVLVTDLIQNLFMTDQSVSSSILTKIIFVKPVVCAKITENRVSQCKVLSP